MDQIDKIDIKLDTIRDDVSDIRTNIVALNIKHQSLEKDVNRLGSIVRKNYADTLEMIGVISNQLNKSAELIRQNADSTNSILHAFSGVRMTVWAISTTVGICGIIYGFLK